MQRRSVVRQADTGNAENAGVRDTGISVAIGLVFVRINDQFSLKALCLVCLSLNTITEGQP